MAAMLTHAVMSLRVGQKAPDFDVVSSSGKSLKLKDFAGKKNVVLYFYPGDFTPICTKETCGFRDMYADLESKDTEVIGVSVDSNESHEKFVAEYGLQFSLVSDKNRDLASRFEERLSKEQGARGGGVKVEPYAPRGSGGARN